MVAVIHQSRDCQSDRRLEEEGYEEEEEEEEENEEEHEGKGFVVRGEGEDGNEE